MDQMQNTQQGEVSHFYAHAPEDNEICKDNQ